MVPHHVGVLGPGPQYALTRYDNIVQANEAKADAAREVVQCRLAADGSELNVNGLVVATRTIRSGTD